MKWLLLSSFFLVTLPAGADTRTVGNGGSVVDCGDHVELLDTYDARILRRMNVSLGAPDLPVKDKITLAATRLAAYDPVRANSILGEARDVFLIQTRFLDNVNLRDVEDANEIALPPGCERRQAAVQNEGVFDSDPYYIVDKRWWDKLDNDGKAALALHEAIFRLSDKKWTASQVRAFNAFLFGDYFDRHPSLQKFNGLLQGSGLEIPVQVFQANGTWYYQVTNRSFEQHIFFPRLTISAHEAGEPGYLPHQTVGEMECRLVGDGVPLSSEELPDFATNLTENFLWAKESMRGLVLARDHGAYATYIVSALDFTPEPNIKTADLWCKSITRPYWTEKTP